MKKKLHYLLIFVCLLFFGQIYVQAAPTLYGALYSSTNGQDTGIYSIAAESGSSFSAVNTTITGKIRTGVLIDDKYHAFVEGESGNTLTTFDAETWQVIGTPIPVTGDFPTNSMAYDFNTGETYAVVVDPIGDFWLNKLDLTTGEYTTIDVLRYYFEDFGMWTWASVSSLAFDEDGNLYAVYNGGIGIVDKTNAHIEQKYAQNHGINGTNLYGGAAIDFDTNKLYYSFANEMMMGNKGLYEVDLNQTTLTRTLLVSFNSAEVFTGLYIQGSTPAPATPLLGYLYSSTNAELANGIYSIEAASGASLSSVNTSITGKIRAGVYINGKYHAFVESESGNTLTTFDAETWQVIGTPIPVADGYMTNSMAYDFNTGETYALVVEAEEYFWLNKLDLTTGEYTAIDEFRYYFEDFSMWTWTNVSHLAFDEDSNLYAVYSQGIGIVDTTNAHIERKYTVSHQISSAYLYGGAVIDFDTNKLYYSFANDMMMGSKGLFEVDLNEETLARTLLVSFNNSEVLSGLFIERETTEPEEPPVTVTEQYLLGTVIDSNAAGFKRSVYSVTTSAPSEMNLVKEMSDLATWDAIYIDGKYIAYVWAGGTDEIGEPLCRLTTYDADTWEVIGSPIYSNTLSYNDKINVMTYDVTSGEVYTVNGTNYMIRKTLGKLNLETGVCTPIDTIRNAAGDYLELPMLAADSKGNLYTILSDKLCSVNKETGVVTEIGSTGLYQTTGKYMGAVIDPATDILYWALYTDTAKGIYATNLTTAATELVYQFTNNEEMTGLVLVDATPADKAPGAITDLVFTPTTNGALTGSLSFKIPSTTADGSVLSGTVNGTILFAGQEHTFNNASAGTTHVFNNVTLAKKGYVLFRVSVSNSVGKSAESNLQYYAGKDTPKAVTNVVLVADAGNDGKPKVTWTAPTEGANEGHLDVTNLRYDLLRLPDNKAITGITGTSYSDDMPGEMAIYYYQVTPYINGEIDRGAPALSNEVLFGGSFTIPYSNIFDEDNFKLWTEVDVNDTGYNWSCEADGALSPSSSFSVFDSWLISPPINFEEEGMYELSYTLKSYNKWRENSFNVTLGTSTSVSTHNVLKAYPDFIAEEETTETVQIIIAEGSTGIRHIAFQITGSPLAGMYFNNVHITKLSSSKAPNVVTEVNNTFNTSGGYYPIISFKAPAIDMNGDALTEITRIDIYRNDSDTPAKTFDSPAVGASLSWEDTGATANQLNEYKFIASNSNGNGEIYNYSIFAGIDIPGPVTDVVAIDDNNKAKITWVAPALGSRNGYIDVASLTYRITRNGLVLAENHSGATYTDETINTGVQGSYTYTVEARNSVGIGEAVSSNTLDFGGAYPIPFTESFAGGLYENGGWTTELLSGSKDTWTLGNIGITLSPGAQDNDGGYAYFAAYDVAITRNRLISPSIDISGAEKPILRFWFYHNRINDDYGERLTVAASADDEAFEPITDVIILDSGSTGWTLYEIPLTGYIGSDDLRIAFEAYTQYYGGNDISIDNITIENQEATDLGIYAVIPPVRLQAGATTPYLVRVRNSGTDAIAAGGYTVEVYTDNTKAIEIQGTAINFGDIAEFTIELPVALDKADTQVVVHCEVNLSGDGNPDNNISDEVTLDVVSSKYEGITALEGEVVENTNKLEWTAPVNPKTPVDVFDGFESYESFIINNVGDWTLIDVDGASTWYPSDYFQLWYANRGAAMAFQVFNSAVAGVEWMNDFNGYSGKQVAISWSATSGTANSDWMISPELIGYEQEIQFYARGINASLPERFTAYYSTTDKETSSFIKLSVGEYDEAISSEWTKFVYKLPGGAKYFAIHRITPLAETALLVDDFMFFKSGGDATVLGYNIYRNNEKLNESPVNATEYIDADLMNDMNYYKVTAVYANGESAYSEEVSIYNGCIAIGQVNNLKAKVYTREQTIVVESVQGTNITVFNVSGATLYNGKSTGKDEFTVSSQGVYIVKIDNYTTKVVVK